MHAANNTSSASPAAFPFGDNHPIRMGLGTRPPWSSSRLPPVPLDVSGATNSISGASAPEAAAAHTTTRHLRDSGVPFGNSRNTRAIGPNSDRNSQFWANPNQFGAGSEPGTRNRPRMAYSCERGIIAKATAMKQNSQPMGFERCRRAMRPPTVE